jgi:MFS family permease
MAVGSLGRALVHRNYRLFLLGQGISLIGTWMQQVAMSWLLYRLTASPFLLGLISFASQIPSLFMSPLAGVVADRWNRHRALMVTQSLAMVQAVLVLVVVHSEGPIVWKLVGLGFFLGLINAFDLPLRQSFLTEMVPDRGLLGNAIALNSSIVNGARLVGPALAGLMIARWGESACFLMNAISYLAVLIALLAMRDLPVRTKPSGGKIFARLHEGFAYAFGFAPLRTLLMLLAVISFMAMATGVLMPVFAKDILKGDAHTQGLLMGASGVGALVAALYLASRSSVLGLGQTIFLAAASFGIVQIALSYATQLWVSLLILVAYGFCMMLTMAGINTLIQTITDEDKRGRVMSIYAMAFTGMAPIGSLFGGGLASQFGAVATARVCGSVCIIAAVLFGLQLPRLRKLVRPIYEKAGILPGQTIASQLIEA